jgi:hypothetical protein
MVRKGWRERRRYEMAGYKGIEGKNAKDMPKRG